MDIWIGVCTGFIFGALLEFSLVNWAARKEAYLRFTKKPTPIMKIQQQSNALLF